MADAIVTDPAGRCPSGQREQTVNLPVHAFEGSNPSRPTLKDPRCGGGPVDFGLGTPRRTSEQEFRNGDVEPAAEFPADLPFVSDDFEPG